MKYVIKNIMMKLNDKMYRYLDDDKSELEDMYDNPRIFGEDMEVYEIIKSQTFIKARLINLNEHLPVEFPWHGHSLEDFRKLNQEMLECAEKIKKCKSRIYATILKNRNKSIYEAYLEIPIRVMEVSDGIYKLGNDGRHRVYVAQEVDSEIPVWIVENIAPKDMSKEFFMRYHAPFNWQFKKEVGCADKAKD